MVWAGLIKIPLKISFYTEIINHSSSKKVGVHLRVLLKIEEEGGAIIYRMFSITYFEF